MTADFIGIAPEDPIRAVWSWRADSMTLARLRPVLDRLHTLHDLPCRFGPVPYTCAREYGNMLCHPCAIRDIRAALFGEQPHEESDDSERPGEGPAVGTPHDPAGAGPDGPVDAVGDDPDGRAQAPAD